MFPAGGLFASNADLIGALHNNNSTYFEPLETIVLRFTSGLDFMGMIHPLLRTNDALTGFGYLDIDIGSEQNNNKLYYSI